MKLALTLEESGALRSLVLRYRACRGDASARLQDEITAMAVALFPNTPPHEHGTHIALLQTLCDHPYGLLKPSSPGYTVGWEPPLSFKKPAPPPAPPAKRIEREFIGMFRGEPQHVNREVALPPMQPLSDEALQTAIDHTATLAQSEHPVISESALQHYDALLDVQLYRSQLLYLPDGEPEDEVAR